MTTLSDNPVSTPLLGGISSAFRLNPFTNDFISVKRAAGAYLETAHRGTYIDMFMGHGSNIIGHSDSTVRDAITKSLDAGIFSGYETGLGDSVARDLQSLVPSAEAVRFTVTGAEAVSMAMRLARAHTGKSLIVKMDGHFNGAGSDYTFLNSLADGADRENPGGTRSRVIPASNGIPTSIQELVVPIPWNDVTALQTVFSLYPDQIAAIVMVPIDYNNGCLTPAPGYLQAARQVATDQSALLVFDEVLSGFKTGLGGAQASYDVTPDLTTLSKALTSGAPLSALVGARSVMETLKAPAPHGAIQGGTYAGNLIGLSAARGTLDHITADPHFYPRLLARTQAFIDTLNEGFQRVGFPARAQSEGCMFGLYIGTYEPVTTYTQVRQYDTALRTAFFQACLDAGIYFHTDFTVSAAHTEVVLDKVSDVVVRIAQQFARRAHH